MIVESPAKSRTIGRYLGRGFKVVSSMGHVRDLLETSLGVDIERGFEPHLVIKDRRVVKKLREEAARASVIYLATDNDREGEAIAYDLFEVLDHQDKRRFQRIVFNEITKKVILKAIEQPGEIDLARVEAQRARRILDRLVGYLVSPLLSKSLSGSRYEGLSAGRVQSVALRLIVDREREIQAFKPEEYWTLEVELGDGAPFRAELVKVKGKKPALGSREAVDALLEELGRAEFLVRSVTEEEQTRTPPPPFITSTLQQAASSLLKFSPKRTMDLAQQLYEGVELEEGHEGLITYMRTDSTRVSAEAQAELRAFIKEEYGAEYLSPEVRFFKSKKAQDAHEAIRPTAVARTPESVKRFLTRDQYRLYKLIWERFVATQMAEARYSRRKAEVGAGDCLFQATGSRLEFEGFLKVLKLQKLADEGVEVPDLKAGERLRLLGAFPEQHFTEPPARYSEAGLVKALEEKGIGRPSTYATIVSTIEERGYVQKEKGVLRPTLLGFVATDFLKRYFPLTVEEGFTAKMEESLDRISEGELSRLDVLQGFYGPFEKQLAKVKREVQDGRSPFRVLTDQECDKCGAPMELRFWKGKAYLGCSRYPECKNTKPLPEGVEVAYVDQKLLVKAAPPSEGPPSAPAVEPKLRCPICGGPMVLRQGKFGRFYGCKDYPKCKGTRPYTIGVPCPLCGAELVERYSPKARRVFYGCSRYPECSFITNARPVKLCPKCAQGVLTERKGKLVCSNKECGYIEAQAEPEPERRAEEPF
ncbi:MAG: type I DNA topoisomerase [Candidatus Acetothermia bacterium]|nr:type I DNA topoisomerase [Candidatus Acetothermia bacterium]MDH7504750.1 type I DNA topoisomerase [Candidatus Acetothermia bacterium]